MKKANLKTSPDSSESNMSEQSEFYLNKLKKDFSNFQSALHNSSEIPQHLNNNSDLRQSNDISEHRNLIKSLLYSFIPPIVNSMHSVPDHARFFLPNEEKLEADSRDKSFSKFQCSSNKLEYEDEGDSCFPNPKVPYHKKARSSFNRMQLYELENIFVKSKYLSNLERIEVARKVKMTDMQVKTWFQNRRTKWR